VGRFCNTSELHVRCPLALPAAEFSRHPHFLFGSFGSRSLKGVSFLGGTLVGGAAAAPTSALAPPTRFMKYASTRGVPPTALDDVPLNGFAPTGAFTTASCLARAALRLPIAAEVHPQPYAVHPARPQTAPTRGLGRKRSTSKISRSLPGARARGVLGSSSTVASCPAPAHVARCVSGAGARQPRKGRGGSSFEFRVSSFGVSEFRVPGFGFRVSGFGFLGFWFPVSKFEVRRSAALGLGSFGRRTLY